jgi:cystathionine beta-lyase/cystathionine gamma-synthase
MFSISNVWSYAMAIAHWLEAHPLVEFVNYPGLKSNAGYDLHHSQASGRALHYCFFSARLQLDFKFTSAVLDHP